MRNIQVILRSEGYDQEGKHIEIRLRVLEQLDEMLGLLKTDDGFLRTSQSDIAL